MNFSRLALEMSPYIHIKEGVLKGFPDWSQYKPRMNG